MNSDTASSCSSRGLPGESSSAARHSCTDSRCWPCAARDLRLQLMQLDRGRQLSQPEKRLQRQLIRRLGLPEQRLGGRRARRAAASSTARRGPARNSHSAGCALQSAAAAPLLWRPRRRPNPDGRSCDRHRPARRGCRADSATASAPRCRRRMRCDIGASGRACRPPAPTTYGEVGSAFCSRSNALPASP